MSNWSRRSLILLGAGLLAAPASPGDRTATAIQPGAADVAPGQRVRPFLTAGSSFLLGTNATVGGGFEFRLTRRISILADVEAGYLFADERSAGSTFAKRLALKVGGAPRRRFSPYLAGGYLDVGVQRGLGVLPASGDGGLFLGVGAEWKLGRRAQLFTEACLVLRT